MGGSDRKNLHSLHRDARANQEIEIKGGKEGVNALSAVGPTTRRTRGERRGD